MSKVNKISGFTRIDREDCEFEWTIENIKYTDLKDGESLESPIFSAECNKKFYFRMIAETTPVAYRRKLNRYIVINLYLYCQNIVNKVRCDYDLSVIVDGKNCHSGTSGTTIIETNNATIGVLLIRGNHDGPMFQYGNSTTIQCKLTLSSGNSTSFLDPKFIVDDNKQQIQKLKFDWIFLKENLSDVKLKTACGKEIPAHRVVLATASPVFKAMFTHDMKENQNKLVEMTDVSHEVAVEMLHYIYTGSVANSKTSLTINLLAAAEKYQLEELKNKCEQQLSSILSIENALEMLKISDTYNADYLKKSAVDFVKFGINKPLEFGEISNMILGKAKMVSK
ncbi:speckle-type POZ protein B-like [Trichogramma pretiosum]|uniref:speckle-type POZ protein B-like n=1 Tax=Trichogramma pretiosum TaxID=7493 RepID=UPI0006C94A22|nr:speckle-type POZ protein B-like [Trichogramma pretiosum]